MHEKEGPWASAVYYLFNAFHEERNAGDPSFLRIMKKPAHGCFYPYAEISGRELQGRRSDGELVWSLSRRLRTLAMVQDYHMIFKSYLRVKRKRQITQTLLVKMSEIVRGEGGRFTVVLFDLEPDERRDYTLFLRSQAIDLVDFDRPERKDKSLRLPDGHPANGLNKLLAEQIEPAQAGPVPVISDKRPALGSRIHVFRGSQLRVAAAIEDGTDFHNLRPPL